MVTVIMQTTPAQDAALHALHNILDRIDSARHDLEQLLLERARAVQAVVAAGVSQRGLPARIGARLSEATVKGDLRRLPPGV